LALKLKTVFLLVGTIVGSVVTVAGLAMAYLYYRKVRKASFKSSESAESLVTFDSAPVSESSQQLVNKES
jgi:hypothetical protein